MDVSPFVLGGVASCVAEAATFPIDTAKTRLQLQGQCMHSSPTHYRGMLDCWMRVCVDEGFFVLYRGLAPALIRQATYGTVKYGLYYTIKDLLPGPETNVRNVASAVVAGSVSSAVATPTDVLKVRMQAHSAPQSSSSVKGGVVACFRDIWVHEGVRGMFRGVVPTAQRAAVIAGVQLPVYDCSKAYFLTHDLMGDGAANHLASSIIAGLCACLASSPVDVIRTRLMNQRHLRTDTASAWHLGDPLFGAGADARQIYRSSLHCAYVTVRTEGVSALYKGFVPAFTRMGPWNVIFFLVYERLKKVLTDKD